MKYARIAGLFTAGLISFSAWSCPVNVNTATAEELMELKNIGAAKAEDLIEYRSAQPFKVPEDLIKVSGVGEATLSANKDCITVE